MCVFVTVEGGQLLRGGLFGLFLEGWGKSSFLSLVGGMISEAGGFKPDVRPGLKVTALQSSPSCSHTHTLLFSASQASFSQQSISVSLCFVVSLPASWRGVDRADEPGVVFTTQARWEKDLPVVTFLWNDITLLLAHLKINYFQHFQNDYSFWVSEWVRKFMSVLFEIEKQEFGNVLLCW